MGVPAADSVGGAAEFLLAESTILALRALSLRKVSAAVEVSLIKLIRSVYMPNKLVVILVRRGVLAIEVLMVRLIVRPARMLLILRREAARVRLKSHAHFIVFVPHVLLEVKRLGLLSVLV